MEQPKFLRSRRRAIWVMALGCFLAVYLAKYLWLRLNRMPPNTPTPLLILGPGMLMLGIAALIDSRYHSRLRRELITLAGRMCFRCGYNLSGCGDSGVCPECGEAFILAALRERWFATTLWRRADNPDAPPPAQER